MPKIIPFPGDDNLPSNTLPQRDIDLLQNLGLHVDYLEPFARRKPFGANIINLTDVKGLEKE